MMKIMSRKVIAGLNLVLVAAALGLPLPVNAQLVTETKQFRSEAGGFEVNYPNDWSASAGNKGSSLVVSFTSPAVRDDDVFQVARIMVCSTPINEKTWNDCTERDTHLSDL